MTVTLTADLWITRTPEGDLELGPPFATHKMTGASLPGAVDPPPFVLRAGSTLMLPTPDGWRA